MKRLLALAAFLLASSAAQAQYTFEYGGRTIHIDPDRGTVSIPGVYDNSGRKSKRTRNTEQDSAHKQTQAPQEAKVEPHPPAAPAPVEAATGTAPQAAAPVAPAASPTAPPPTTTANNAPADGAMLPPPPAPPAPSPAQQDAAVQPAPATAPSVVVLPAPAAPQPPPAPPAAPQQTATIAPAPAPSPPPAVRDPNSPVGVWLTEEKEGKVRIEQCGNNLCGYSVDTKSNLNGEQVLINMKPGKDQKWSGRILDPNTGSTYDSTIALKGPDTLRVQGCAFGGMFCGGQTWTRVN